MLYFFNLENEITREERIKSRMKVFRNVLVSELEPRALATVLSKSETFLESNIDSVYNARTCYERVDSLLSLVENGNSEAVNVFVTVLKDLGYDEIVELIDPIDIHSKAGKNVLNLSILQEFLNL